MHSTNEPRRAFKRVDRQELLEEIARLERLADLVHQPELAARLREMAKECRAQSISW